MARVKKNNRALLKKYNEDIVIGFQELQNMDKIKSSTSNLAERTSKLNEIKNIMELRRPLVRAKIHKLEIIQLTLSIISVLFLLVIPTALNYHQYLSTGTHINISYYALIVGLVPVLMIGIYIGQPKSLMIESKLSAWSELIARVLPSILAIAAGLYAVASQSSNMILFLLTLYGIFQLSLIFVYAIMTPGLSSED